MLRQLAALRRRKSRLPLVLRQRSIDLPVVVRLVRSRPRREIRQLLQHAHSASPCIPRSAHPQRACAMPHPPPPPACRSVRRGSAFEITTRAAIRSPPSSTHAFARQNLRHRHARRHHRPRLARRIAEVERHHPHAALHISPHPRHAAQPPRRMMKPDRRRARIERARIRPDHALAQIRRPAAARREDSAPQTPPSTSRTAPPAPRRSSPSRSSICSRVGASPIHTSRFARQAAAHRAAGESRRIIAFHPFTSPGAKRSHLRLAALVVIPKLNARAIEKGNKQPIHRRSPVETPRAAAPSSSTTSGCSSPAR